MSFESGEDLEMIMGRRLVEHMERSKIWLVLSPYWLKIGPCPTKCDSKDLMLAIRSTLVVLSNLKQKGIFFELKFHWM